jgi:hypothetical protein
MLFALRLRAGIEVLGSVLDYSQAWEDRILTENAVHRICHPGRVEATGVSDTLLGFGYGWRLRVGKCSVRGCWFFKHLHKRKSLP